MHPENSRVLLATKIKLLILIPIYDLLIIIYQGCYDAPTNGFCFTWFVTASVKIGRFLNYRVRLQFSFKISS